MSTATVAAPELDERLDFSPVCDTRDCDQPAVWSGRLKCGHSWVILQCDPCRASMDKAVSDVTADGYRCRSCDVLPVAVWRPLRASA